MTSDKFIHLKLEEFSAASFMFFCKITSTRRLRLSFSAVLKEINLSLVATR